MNTYNEFFTKRVNTGERATASLQKYKRAKGLPFEFHRHYLQKGRYGETEI
ncbi:MULTISPECIES: hypothetical protein [unclassified Flavobacterium]|jgi:hypothetical protein|uniref:hypothetical protein n=1 Tax=unclassified Flavobacterium TaxID=196869 RepID=UPI0012AA5115|nr:MULTISPECIES: hypothetical protein [unclassified Flavobacterium]MBF4485047.1 hypothetical protein [Flavobacterium sp. CSZ]QGK75273.1 hypothetical protein GIY83_14665 [Flavobacterium sp. SLB02]